MEGKKIQLTNITNYILRIHEGKVYYFNTNGVYCCIPEKEAEKLQLIDIQEFPTVINLEYRKKYYSHYIPNAYNLFDSNTEIIPCHSQIATAIHLLNENDTLNTFFEMINERWAAITVYEQYKIVKWHDVSDCVMKIQDGIIGYFDNDCIFHEVTLEQAQQMDLFLINNQEKLHIKNLHEKDIMKYYPKEHHLIEGIYEHTLTAEHIRKIVKQLNEGDTFEIYKKLCEEHIKRRRKAVIKYVKEDRSDLQLKDISNYILRIWNNQVGYFTDEGIYHIVPYDDALKMKLYDIESDPQILSSDRIIHAYSPSDSAIVAVQEGQPRYGIRRLKKVITNLQEGDSLEYFLHQLKTVQIEAENKPLPTGIDRFITKINRPRFERETGNDNKKTFDFIRIEAYVCHEWDNRHQYIQDNLKEIKKRILTIIEDSKQFQKYGVPVNILRLTKLTLTHDDALVFLFEVKHI